ncbi:MAG: tRNA (guanosine(37)-N1)-methyltransferase TrmD [Candidatus Levybacteria bacterium RIFCSPLOWO2_02_FULL_36_8b]|nr:MAG: tRNA (guanosine(37)-N1)-methyltransferase TrmD [Candidatus Levybacteria bacterium RIFCSPLOWO2_02_FULL_36_8b]
MKVTILTLFPEMFEGPFKYSIVKRAIEKKIASLQIINIRNFGIGKHKIVDDRPYGGGAGMVLRVDVVEKAIDAAKCKNKCKEKIILLDPQGKQLNQQIVRKLSKIDHLILVCAHYEGIDERVRKLVDEEISIGDYILTGGELPAMILTDAVIRLLPKALGKEESSQFESFEEIIVDGKKLRLLEYPQYTRPTEFKTLKVPKILQSGDHQEILKWREKEAIKKTLKRRPDLFPRRHFID